jgi:type II secretory pathway pseudopilin PulG
MMEHPLPGVIVFGVLLAITLYGLFRSNEAAKRNNATTNNADSRQDTYVPTEMNKL